MHDEEEASVSFGDEEGAPPSLDWLTLNSVGIDIGSSTSHLTFSRLVLKRNGLQFSSRFEVVDQEVLYRSPILLTPFLDMETIDIEPLSSFITQSYREAGIDPSQTDTGAVICTGEAARNGARRARRAAWIQAA